MGQRSATLVGCLDRVMWKKTPKGWKRDLLEEDGVDFDLGRARAAMHDRRQAIDKKMGDRASLMAERRARLLI